MALLNNQTLIRTLVLALTASFSIYAQDARGTLVGRVIDPTGASIPDAEVRAINNSTKVVAAARSNASGNYALPYLIPGTYTVQVEMQGFKKFLRENIQIRVNDMVAMDITMAIGDVA